MADDQFNAIYQQLIEDYLLSVSGTQLPAMKQQWSEIKTSWDTDKLGTLHRAAHTMMGTSGSFSLHDISRMARRLEQNLKHLMATPKGKSSRIVIDEVTHLFRELTTIVSTHSATKAGLPISDHSAEKAVAKGTQTKSIEDVRVVLLGDNDKALKEVASGLSRFGFNTHILPSPLHQATHDQWDVAIVNCTTSYWPTLQPLVHTLSLNGTPVLVSADNDGDDFSWRLELIRVGAEYLDTRDLQILLLVRRLYSMLKLDAERPVRVLMLDDDTTLLRHFEQLFRQFGLEATLLSEPSQILHVTNDFTPDIFVLDLHMPDVTGIEVAQIIRSMELFQTTPIMFLSADESIDSKLAIVRNHADDLLSKTVPSRELLLQLIDRATRGRRLRDLMAKDSLTGLLNHNHILESAQRQFLLSARQNEHMTLAMVDLDYFKRVNDTYGHVTGDQVLLSLSMLLKTQLRQTDLLGRFGGEEFVVVLSNNSSENASTKLDSIRELFSQVRFQSAGESFHCTFSVGAAHSSDYGTFEDMLLAADAALYEAKLGGRDRVVFAKGVS